MVKSDNEVILRILYGIGLGTLSVGILIGGGPLLFIAVAVVSVMGLREFYRLVRVEGGRTLDLVGYPTAVLLLALVYQLEESVPSGGVDILATGFILIAFLIQVARASMGKPLYRVSELSTTFFGVFLTAGLLSYIFRFHSLADLFPDASWPAFVLIPVVGAWGYDSSAFFSGKFFGEATYLPHVSRKTWEGTAGGLLGVSVGMAFFAGITGLAQTIPELGKWWSLGLICGLAAQVGDLGFSVFKREMQLKDSGNSIPGHGGILDRLDSFLFVLPVAFTLMGIFFGMSG